MARRRCANDAIDGPPILGRCLLSCLSKALEESTRRTASVSACSPGGGMAGPTYRALQFPAHRAGLHEAVARSGGHRDPEQTIGISILIEIVERFSPGRRQDSGLLPDADHREDVRVRRPHGVRAIVVDEGRRSPNCSRPTIRADSMLIASQGEDEWRRPSGHAHLALLSSVYVPRTATRR